MNKYLLLFVVIFFSKITRSQETVKFNVIPPSPNSASLGQFGDIPVGLATGIPEIKIPIFNYQAQNGKLPIDISLMYHGGGIKVNEIASNVGLGWALENGGGVISRTVVGLPDDVSGFIGGNSLPDAVQTILRIDGCQKWDYLGDYADPAPTGPACPYPNSCISRTDFQKYMQVYQGLQDGQCDIFQYNFGQYSGKFIIGKDGSISQLPKTDLKIEYTQIPGRVIENFTVTTPDGFQYDFDEIEYNNSGSKTNITVTGGGASSYSNSDVDPECYTSWYVSKIYSPSKTESISFTYQGAILQYEDYRGDSYSNALDQNVAGFLTKNEMTYGENGIYPSSSEYNFKRIKQIKVSNGVTIDFYYDATQRLDMIGDVALNQIQISDAKNSYGYKFYHSYWGSGQFAYQRRLVLDSLKKFSGNVYLPAYKFTYNPMTVDRMSFAQDD